MEKKKSHTFHNVSQTCLHANAISSRLLHSLVSNCSIFTPWHQLVHYAAGRSKIPAFSGKRSGSSKCLFEKMVVAKGCQIIFCETCEVVVLKTIYKKNTNRLVCAPELSAGRGKQAVSKTTQPSALQCISGQELSMKGSRFALPLHSRIGAFKCISPERSERDGHVHTHDICTHLDTHPFAHCHNMSQCEQQAVILEMHRHLCTPLYTHTAANYIPERIDAF